MTIGFLRTLVLIAAVALAGIATGQDAPVVGKFSVNERRVDGVMHCQVTFEPSLTLGDSQAPRLTLSSARGSQRATLAVQDMTRYSQVDWVQNNTRKTASASSVPMTSLSQNALYKALVSRQPLSVTARLKSGTYVSSRFEGFDLDAILLEASEICGFFAEPLSDSVRQRAEQQERRLAPRKQDMLKVRWLLAGSTPNATQPTATGALSVSERDTLLKYLVDKGLPPSRYLSATSLDALLAEPWRPRPNVMAWMQDPRVHDDWRSYSYEAGATTVCGMLSEGIIAEPNGFWQVPTMRYEADRGRSGNGMNLYMVFPNPFDSSEPIWAQVDGTSYTLQTGETGDVWPVGDSGGLDNSVIRAIRRGSSIVISGTSKATGGVVSVRFSADGFTAAFNRMADTCARPSIHDWIR